MLRDVNIGKAQIDHFSYPNPGIQHQSEDRAVSQMIADCCE
jgi:hypothetical protein